MKIKAYTLSTCPYCKAFKNFMNENHIPFEFTDVDLLEGEERKKALKDAYFYCDGCGFPIIVIDSIVIEGFNEPKLKEVLHL